MTKTWKIRQSLLTFLLCIAVHPSFWRMFFGKKLNKEISFEFWRLIFGYFNGYRSQCCKRFSKTENLKPEFRIEFGQCTHARVHPYLASYEISHVFGLQCYEMMRCQNERRTRRSITGHHDARTRLENHTGTFPLEILPIHRLLLELSAPRTKHFDA